jgi:mRNA interferase MazF
MPINFHPKRGTVLICDFDGFKKPEMVKRRHVVVVSPRYRRHSGLCLVVPFSTVQPYEIEPHHYEIVCGRYDFFDTLKPSWAKGDMLTCVSFERLDRLMLYGKHAAPQLRPDDLRQFFNALLTPYNYILTVLSR